MSEADIEKAVKEAAEFEAQDKKRKEAIETRNDADAFVFQTEKALEEVGDKIDASDKANVEADLAALKSLVENTNAEEMTESQVEEMKAAKEKLMNSAQQLFTKVYEQAQAGASAGPAPDMGGASAGPAPDMGSTGSADDNVVDADYKEV